MSLALGNAPPSCLLGGGAPRARGGYAWAPNLVAAPEHSGEGSGAARGPCHPRAENKAGLGPAGAAALPWGLLGVVVPLLGFPTPGVPAPLHA